MIRSLRCLFVAVLTVPLCACVTTQTYVAESEADAINLLDRSANESLPAAKRMRLADGAIRSNFLRGKDRVDAFYYRGIAFHDMGNYKAALNDFDELLRLAPRDGDGYGVRGNALYMLGYYDDAIDDYRRARQLTGNRR